MSPKQKKIAAKAPPPNVFNEKDLAVLREEKAKGRGMGLQDEKVQPGKVQKAVLGKIVKGVKSMFRGKGTSNNNTMMVRGKSSGMGSMLPKLLQKAIDDGTLKTAKKGKMIKAKRGRMMFPGYLDTFTASSSASTPKNMRGVTTIVGVKPGSEIGKGKKKFKSMEEMRKAKGFKTIDGKQETSSQFNKRRTALAGAKQAAKSTRVGKIVLPIAAAGVGAIQYLKSKIKKKEDKNKKTLKDFREQKKPGIPSEATKTKNRALNKLNKKMGGGMMQRPMGYTQGGGADSGRVGEMKSKITLGADRLKKLGVLGGVGKRTISPEDRERIKNLRGRKKVSLSKKMGGGMMQRPMGYAVGGPSSPTTGPMNIPRDKDGKPIKRQRRAGPSAGRPGTEKKRKPGLGAAGLGALGGVGGKKEKIPNIIITKGGAYTYTKPKIDEKKGRHFRQHKSYDASPRLISDAQGKTTSLRSMNAGGMTKPMGYKSGTSVKVKCKLGRNKPTKMY